MQRILKMCQQSSSGGDLLEEQLVNSGAPEIVIYLRTSLRASFRRKSLTRAFRADLHEQICIATTRFVWKVVILSNIEASGLLLNSRTLKMHSYKRCFLEAKRGGSSELPRTPLAYRPVGVYFFSTADNFVSRLEANFSQIFSLHFPHRLSLYPNCFLKCWGSNYFYFTHST